ncbi:MAG: hypothetical protein RLZZ142_333 [Verrucomicrobiota bacterium]
MSSALGLSTSLVYKWAQPPGEGGSGATNPLDRIAQLLELTQDERIAHWICERAGGFFVKNPGPSQEVRAQSVVSGTNAVVQEFAEMLSAIATAAVDNAISESETTAIRERWQHLKSATEEFVRCCERGDFEGMGERRD